MSWGGERGTRHERGYGYAWQKRRALALQRDAHLCQPCWRDGRVTQASEVDHITPKHLDGEDDFDNLQSICTPCHKAKTQAEAKARQGARTGPTFDKDGWPVWPA